MTHGLAISGLRGVGYKYNMAQMTITWRYSQEYIVLILVTFRQILTC